MTTIRLRAGSAEPSIAKYSCKECHRDDLSREDFPKSPHTQSGYLKTCKRCFGKSITIGRRAAQSRALRGAVDLLPRNARTRKDKIALANEALRSANGDGGGVPVLQVTKQFTQMIRESVKRLKAFGVEMTSMSVEGKKLKVVYRIEEETDL